jgi:hypothetical protein
MVEQRVDSSTACARCGAASGAVQWLAVKPKHGFRARRGRGLAPTHDDDSAQRALRALVPIPDAVLVHSSEAVGKWR